MLKEGSKWQNEMGKNEKKELEWRKKNGMIPNFVDKVIIIEDY